METTNGSVALCTSELISKILSSKSLVGVHESRAYLVAELFP